MPRSTVVIASLVASAVVLSGCSASEPEPESDVAAVDIGAPASEATAPGTALSFGEPAWVESPQGPDDNPGLVGLTVLQIDAQDPATFWDEQYGDDADEFAGLTPYTVVTQTDFTANPVPESYFPTDPQVVGVYPDGGFSQFAVTAGGGRGNDCGLTLPEWDPYDDEQHTLLSCYVLGAEEGQTIDAVAYAATRYTEVAIGSGPYWDAPVVWTP